MSRVALVLSLARQVPTGKCITVKAKCGLVRASSSRECAPRGSGSSARLSGLAHVNADSPREFIWQRSCHMRGRHREQVSTKGLASAREKSMCVYVCRHARWPNCLRKPCGSPPCSTSHAEHLAYATHTHLRPRPDLPRRPHSLVATLCE